MTFKRGLRIIKKSQVIVGLLTLRVAQLEKVEKQCINYARQMVGKSLAPHREFRKPECSIDLGKNFVTKIVHGTIDDNAQLCAADHDRPAVRANWRLSVGGLFRLFPKNRVGLRISKANARCEPGGACR